MIYTKEKLEELRHRWATPRGKKMVKIIKDTRCYLSPVLFREKIHNLKGINDEEVENAVDLRGIPLSGYDFRVSIQENDDDFQENMAILSNIHFEGATLKHCIFEEGKIHNCNFEQSDISHSIFKNAVINNCYFQEAELYATDFQSSKLIDCNIMDASIKDVIFTNAIVDQKTKFGDILLSEKNKNFHFASIEYKQIKEMYKNSSLHDISDLFHYKEMVCKRKIAKITNPKRWTSYLFGDLLCKYGTSFIRVFIAGFLVVLGCAIIYYLNNSLLFHNKPVHPSIFDSLYFSIVSFTTVGFGDYHAIDWTRFLAAAEGFIGASLTALFTVIVGRKIIRE